MKTLCAVIQYLNSKLDLIGVFFSPKFQNSLASDNDLILIDREFIEKRKKIRTCNEKSIGFDVVVYFNSKLVN